MSWLPQRIPAEHHAPGCECDRHDRNDAVTITITPTVEGWSIYADRRDTGEAREDTANRVLGRHADGSEAVVILGNRPSLEAALRSIGRNLDHGRI